MVTRNCLGKLQEFFEFGRHFVVYHAGADLFSALIFDIIACFLAVFDSAKYSFCMAIQRECKLFIVLNPFYLENKLYIGICRFDSVEPNYEARDEIKCKPENINCTSIMTIY